MSKFPFSAKRREAFSNLCLASAFMQISHTRSSLSVNNHRWHLEEGEIAPHDFHICIKLSQSGSSKQTPTQKQTQKPLSTHTHTSGVYLQTVWSTAAEAHTFLNGRQLEVHIKEPKSFVMALRKFFILRKHQLLSQWARWKHKGGIIASLCTNKKQIRVLVNCFWQKATLAGHGFIWFTLYAVCSHD